MGFLGASRRKKKKRGFFLEETPLGKFYFMYIIQNMVPERGSREGEVDNWSNAYFIINCGSVASIDQGQFWQRLQS